MFEIEANYAKGCITVVSGRRVLLAGFVIEVIFAEVFSELVLRLVFFRFIGVLGRGFLYRLFLRTGDVFLKFIFFKLRLFAYFGIIKLRLLAKYVCLPLFGVPEDLLIDIFLRFRVSRFLRPGENAGK